MSGAALRCHFSWGQDRPKQHHSMSKNKVFCLSVGTAAAQAMMLQSQDSWGAPWTRVAITPEFTCPSKSRIRVSAGSGNALSGRLWSCCRKRPAVPVLVRPVPAAPQCCSHSRGGWSCAGNPRTLKHPLLYASLDQQPSTPGAGAFLPAHVLGLSSSCFIFVFVRSESPIATTSLELISFSLGIKLCFPSLSWPGFYKGGH